MSTILSNIFSKFCVYVCVCFCVPVRKGMETFSQEIYLAKKKRQKNLRRDMKCFQKGLTLFFILRW